jgi:hypothetical protein
MRTRKTAVSSSAMTRLGQSVLNYIDLFVRTICIILGLVVSGWVKFIDEITPPAAPTRVSMTSPHWSPSRQLAPLPGVPTTAAQPTYTSQPPLYR